MTKKKAASSQTTGAKAAAAAKPARPEESVRPATAPNDATLSSATPVTRPPFRRPQSLNFAGVGRNDICPCGSGKRFKNCHGH